MKRTHITPFCHDHVQPICRRFCGALLAKCYLGKVESLEMLQLRGGTVLTFSYKFDINRVQDCRAIMATLYSHRRSGFANAPVVPSLDSPGTSFSQHPVVSLCITLEIHSPYNSGSFSRPILLVQ